MKRIISLTAIVAVGLGLAACTPATSAEPDSADAVVNDCTEQLAPEVEAAKAPLELVIPDEPIDVGALEGEDFFFIGLTLNEFTMSVVDGVTEAADAAGVNVTIWDGQGTVNRVTEGIETAIAQGAAAIATNGVDPELVPAALQAAADAGIPIVATFAGDTTAVLPDAIYSNISSDFTADGELIAKWALVDSGCDTDLLMVSSSTIAVWERQSDGARAVFEEYCEACGFDAVSVDAANMATDTPAQVQTALQRNPDTEYIYMAWDSGVPFISSIVASSATPVEVLGRDGIEASLSEIARGGAQSLTLAMPPGLWIGYATIDDMFRAASGLPSAGTVIPGRLVDADNVGSGSLEDVSPNYIDFQGQFLELWGLSQ